MEAVTTFLSDHARNIIVLCATYLLGYIVLTLLARRINKGPSGFRVNQARQRRIATVARLAHGTGHAALLFMVGIGVLRLFNVDPTPIIASAGIVGLVIGVGAQSLVRDFVSGMFIIAENQFGVGDTVTLGNYTGTVERLTVRSTVLRDTDGNSVYMPNGSITTVVNQSQRQKT